jgi:hypothetical protein
MDRCTVYPGQVPLENDILRGQKFAMEGVGWLARAVMGRLAAVEGLGCIPTTPGSLSVTIEPGMLTIEAPTDATNYSTLAADARGVVKQGIMRDGFNLTLSPPATAGHAVTILIQAQLSEVDADPVTLPYFNAANPSVGWTGPNNNGQAQNTTRACRVVVQAKSGTSAPSGTQAPPSPDAGWTPLHFVVLTNGQSVITGSHISEHPSSRVVRADLVEIPHHSRDQRWAYAVAGGTANALAVELVPRPTELRAGMMVALLASATNTGAATLEVLGLSAAPIVHHGGRPLVEGDILNGAITVFRYTGSQWQIASPTAANVRRRRVPVPPQAEAFSITAADEGTTFVADLSTRELLRLPNPRSVPDGWWVRFEVYGTPSGFQTSRIEVLDATPSTSQSVEARRIFYAGGDRAGPQFLPVIGRGQVYELVARLDRYVVSSVTPPGSIAGRITSGNGTWLALAGTSADWQGAPTGSFNQIQDAAAQLGAPASGTRYFETTTPGLYQCTLIVEARAVSGTRRINVAMARTAPSAGMAGDQLLASNSRNLTAGVQESVTCNFVLRLDANVLVHVALFGDQNIEINPQFSTMSLQLIGA